MITYIENDYMELPMQSEIVHFSSSNIPKNMSIDHWYHWVEDQGNLIVKIVCDDGVIMVVRIRN